MRADERGFVLLGVAVLATVGMALWALAYSATGDTIRAESYRVRRANRDESVTRCLVAAVALLRTGPPPTARYRCIFEVAGNRCTVTYTRTRGAKTWRVEALPATRRDLAQLPNAPASFAKRGKG